MGQWPGITEGLPADNSSLVSSVVRDRLDGLFYADFKPLRVRAEVPPSMRVYVEPSYGHIVRSDYNSPVFWWGGYTSNFSAPVTYPRVDMVYVIPQIAGSVGIVVAAEASQLQYAAIPAGAIGVGYVYLRPGMTSVKDVDDGVNGYIVYRIQPWISSTMGGYNVVAIDVTNYVNNTADSQYHSMISKTVGAGALSTFKRLHIKARGTIVANDDVTGFSLVYGGTGMITLEPTVPYAGGTKSFLLDVIMSADGSASAQLAHAILTISQASLSGESKVYIGRGTATENSANALNIQLFSKIINSGNNVTLEDFEVLLIG